MTVMHVQPLGAPLARAVLVTSFVLTAVGCGVEAADAPVATSSEDLTTQRLPGPRDGSFTEVGGAANGFFLARPAESAWVRIRFSAYQVWEGDASFPEASEPARLIVRRFMANDCLGTAFVVGTKVSPSTHELVIELRDQAPLQVVLGNVFRRAEPRVARRLFVSDLEVTSAAAPSGSVGLPPGACTPSSDGPDDLPDGFDPFAPSACTGRLLTRSQRVALVGSGWTPGSRRLDREMDVYVRTSSCTPSGCSSPGAPKRMRSADLDAVTAEVTLFSARPTPAPGKWSSGELDVTAGFALWGQCTGHISCSTTSCGGDLLAERAYFHRADGQRVDTCENRTVTKIDGSGRLEMRRDCARLAFQLDKGTAAAWTRYEVAGVVRY